VSVPWHDWLADLETERFDNPKFVPVKLVDYTAGYDSECAVLFPETVAVAGRPQNTFGAIFCDREADRFRRMIGAATEILSINLPPDGAGLVVSEQLSEQAFALWDLIHDRAHSRGELPFDPFMIRKRMPYWMYALEELRCDLTAYARPSRWSVRALASPATSSTPCCWIGCCAFQSPASAFATTTASAASCCSRSCAVADACTGPTTA
jgi:hypothetical protein